MSTEVQTLVEIAAGALEARDARRRIREAGSLIAAADRVVAELASKAYAAAKAHRQTKAKAEALSQTVAAVRPDGADAGDARAEGPRAGGKRPRAAEPPPGPGRAPKRPRPGAPPPAQAHDDAGASVHLGDIVLPTECLVADDDCDAAPAADVVRLHVRDARGPAVCALRAGGARGRLLRALHANQGTLAIARATAAAGLRLSVSTAAARLRGNVRDPARHVDGRSGKALQMEVLMRHWYPEAFDGVVLDEGSAKRLAEVVAGAEAEERQAEGGNDCSRRNERRSAARAAGYAAVDPAAEQQKALVCKRSPESFELQDLYAKLRPRHPALAEQPERVWPSGHRPLPPPVQAPDPHSPPHVKPTAHSPDPWGPRARPMAERPHKELNPQGRPWGWRGWSDSGRSTPDQWHPPSSGTALCSGMGPGSMCLAMPQAYWSMKESFHHQRRGYCQPHLCTTYTGSRTGSLAHLRSEGGGGWHKASVLR